MRLLHWSTPADDSARLQSHLNIYPGAPPLSEAIKVIEAAIAESAPQLAPFSGDSSNDSAIRIGLRFAGTGQGLNWKTDRSTHLELRLKSNGWTLDNCRRGSFQKKTAIRLSCAPFELLEASGQHVHGPCPDLLLSWIREGLFQIDQPLPGCFGSPSHPEPLSALSYCALKGREEWTRALLALGADPNSRSAYGKTALHACAASGAFGCAKILLAAGADPLAKNRGGKTPASCIDYDRGGAFAQELKAACAAIRESRRIRESIEPSPESLPLAPRKASTRI